MRATFMYGSGDVRVETVPDPELRLATDALVRVVRSCICGSDLHPYHSMPASAEGRPMGHEFLGVVEDTGSDVSTRKRGDFVIGPFAISDNTCEFCREGLHTSCRHGSFWGGDNGGAQAEAVRVPLADGTLVKAPVGEDSVLLPSLLTLSDVFLTGHHAAFKAHVDARTTVTVVGDGAVGLSAVLAAERLGAERIILMGRHKDRTDLGVEFGATDVVPGRGDEGIAAVRELTGGDGTHVVIEAVGHLPAGAPLVRDNSRTVRQFHREPLSKLPWRARPPDRPNAKSALRSASRTYVRRAPTTRRRRPRRARGDAGLPSPCERPAPLRARAVRAS
jgi:threonine dehydrogenase-like Zn-dependent dehydrogenase